MTTSINEPHTKPNCANFSSGPCAKYPNWDISDLNLDSLGRSHRSNLGKERLNSVIEQTREILNIPADYKIGIVPASDTGAFEMSLWSVLNNDIGVDIYAWETFGFGWANDVKNHLKISDVNIVKAQYGKLPDLIHNENRDLVFTYNGTTSGVKLADTNWIKKDRTGLTICDATSAIFVEDLDWEKLDITTWSWQKALGGEGAHGIIIMSPRAVARLEKEGCDNRPLPKIFRMTKDNKLIDGIFKGITINTPSMLCVEDLLACYRWIKKIGGRSALQKRSYKNLEVVANWVEKHDWVEFLASNEKNRSSTAMCLTLKNSELVNPLCELLEQKKVAYDIRAHCDAPKGIRIWGGPTVESKDIEILTDWITWAYHKLQQK